MTNYTEALFNEKDYPRAKEFLPERWLTEDGREVLKELPKSYMPFGVGWCFDYVVMKVIVGDVLGMGLNVRVMGDKNKHLFKFHIVYFYYYINLNSLLLNLIEMAN